MAKEESKEDRSPKNESHPKPPPAPDILRRPLLTPLQRFGLPLLTLIPLLAIMGFLGVNRASVSSESQPLQVELDYPVRARKGVRTDLVIRVENAGPEPMRDVTVTIARDYVDVFAEFTSTPAPTEVVDSAYRIDLGELPAGESRLVVAEVRPGWEYGQRRGTITAEAAGMDEPVSVDIATFNFP